MRWVGGLMLTAAMGLVGTPAGAVLDHADAPALEREFVSAVNSLRAKQGLAPLTVHPNLTAKARSWAGVMSAEGGIRHSRLSDGITVPWHVLGENVGVGATVSSLHDAFVASPTHYENLVEPAFEYVGVGVVIDGAGTIWVAQEFMMPPALDPAIPSSTPPPEPGASTDTVAGPRNPDPPRSVGGAGPAADHPAPAASTRIEAVLARLRLLDG